VLKKEEVGYSSSTLLVFPRKREGIFQKRKTSKERRANATPVGIVR
jgi:hypothetical protein